MTPINPSPPQPAIELVFFLRPISKGSMYRKSYSRSNRSKSSWSDAVPRWSQAQTDTTNMMARMLFEKLGITDLKGYFEKLLVPIVICVVIGAVAGAISGGWSGMFWYALAGIGAPAALIWMTAVLPYVLLYVAAYIAVWFALIYAVYFVLSH